MGMTPEEAIKDLKYDNERCLRICEGACLNIEKNQCNCRDGVIERMLDELLQYREIGTVEECRKAVEKQKAKKCVIDPYPDYTHYKCPSCGKIHLSRYKHGCPSLGRIPRFCEYCGQAIDENLEGIKDGQM